MSWQPIETAPRDGTAVLLASPRSGGWRVWTSEGWQVRRRYLTDEPKGDWRGRGARNLPTHWQLLPEPPEEKK